MKSSPSPTRETLISRLRAAKQRVRYWQTVSPSNTRKSRGEGMELAKADVEQLTYFLSLLNKS